MSIKGFQVATILSNGSWSHNHTSLVKLCIPFLSNTLIPMIDALTILKYIIFIWCGYFLSTGSIPVDILLEHHISGGKELYYTAISTSHVIMMAVLTFVRVSFLVFVHYIEFLHDFLLDILVSDHLWFFAPLLWMILTYITLYL